LRSNHIGFHRENVIVLGETSIQDVSWLGSETADFANQRSVFMVLWNFRDLINLQAMGALVIMALLIFISMLVVFVLASVQVLLFFI
jgi:hypothetical protein